MIICGDTISEMKKMADESVDVIITSPPYNLLNSTGSSLKSGNSFKWKNAAIQKGYKSHKDSMKREDYVNWMKECITEMFRVLKPNGAIFFNHKFRVQGGLMEGQRFLQKHLKFPEDLLQQGIEGKVFISLIVNADGSIGQTKVLKGTSYDSFNNEALRIVNKMHNWQPALKKDSSAVRQILILPIDFRVK